MSREPGLAREETAFDDLRPFCAQVIDARIVDEGMVVTAREARERIRRQVDYPPDSTSEA